MVRDIAVGVGLGSITRQVKSGTMSLTVRHHCDVSSEMCSLQRFDPEMGPAACFKHSA